MNTTDEAPRCPLCGGVGVPVVYGLPAYEAFLEQQQGLIKLGGCVVPDHGSPVWSCANDHDYTADAAWVSLERAEWRALLCGEE